MKHLLLTTIAAVVLVGCGPSVDIHQAAIDGDIETVKQAIDDGADVNAKNDDGVTPLDASEDVKDWHAPEKKAAKKEIPNLLRKHGGKTGEEKKLKENELHTSYDYNYLAIGH